METIGKCHTSSKAGSNNLAGYCFAVCFIRQDVFDCENKKTIQGFSVELIPATRGGGVDLYAALNTSPGNHLYVIECKRYAASHKVGIGLVLRRYEVTLARGATTRSTRAGRLLVNLPPTSRHNSGAARCQTHSDHASSGE